MDNVIINILISEIKLSKNQANVLLFIIKNGQMTAKKISTQFQLSIQNSLLILNSLVKLGGLIEISTTEFETMHPRFTMVNIYRNICKKNNFEFKKNIVIDNLGASLEDDYYNARTK